MRERTPDVWRLRYMASGKQREKTFKGDRNAATRELMRLQSAPPQQTPELAPGAAALPAGQLEPSGPPEPTFGELLDRWMALQAARGRSPKYLDENRRHIAQRIRPALGDIPISQLSGHHLDAAYTEWQGQGLADSSVHRLHATISSALSQGVKWGLLADSPARRATPPSNRPTRTLRTPTPEEVGQLVSMAESSYGHPMAIAIALAYATGCRRGELCALRWSDITIDGGTGTVRVERSLSQVGGELKPKSTKTGRSRTVALDGRMVLLLRHHEAAQKAFAEQVGVPLDDDPYLLSMEPRASQPVPPDSITNRFDVLREKCGLEDIRFHDLRHAHVSELLSAGIDATTVATRVGHASTRMTLDRYAHALPGADKAAAAVIGPLLPGHRDDGSEPLTATDEYGNEYEIEIKGR